MDLVGIITNLRGGLWNLPLLLFFWDYLLDELFIIIFWDYLLDENFWILIELGFLIYIKFFLSIFLYISTIAASSSFYGFYFLFFGIKGRNTTYYSNQFSLLPIINNSPSLIISMLIINLTLLLFCFVFSYYLGNLMFVKSIVECFIKPTIHTIASMYFSSSFCVFLKGFAYKS